jgi:hypothetical protein
MITFWIDEETKKDLLTLRRYGNYNKKKKKLSLSVLEIKELESRA